MTQNGEDIYEYLTNYRYEISLGIKECDHQYSQNGTISCIECGKIKSKKKMIVCKDCGNVEYFSN